MMQGGRDFEMVIVQSVTESKSHRVAEWQSHNFSTPYIVKFFISFFNKVEVKFVWQISGPRVTVAHLGNDKSVELY